MHYKSICFIYWIKWGWFLEHKLKESSIEHGPIHMINGMKKLKMNLELEMRKIYQRCYCEISVNSSRFYSNSTKPWRCSFKTNQLYFWFSNKRFPSFLLLTDTQLFQVLFHLTAFGYIPDLHRPKHATCEPWRFMVSVTMHSLVTVA
jgi:hypothetical protein